MSSVDSLAVACWPLSDLADAFTALVRHSKIGSPTPTIAASPSAHELDEWLNYAARNHGCELEPFQSPLRDLRQELLVCGPALLQLSGNRYLAVVKGGRKLRVITPHLSLKNVPANSVYLALRRPFEANLRPQLSHLLDGSDISQQRRQHISEMLLAVQTGGKRLQNCWLLRPQTSSSLNQTLHAAGFWTTALNLMAAHIIQYLLLLASWAVLGTLSFSGHLDRGWLLVWALLLASLLPFRLLTTWLQGVIAIRLGGLLKKRLLEGALRLEPEEVRAQGIGAFLAQALEAESVETLAISGGVAGVLALLELAPAMFILGKLSWLLLVFCLVAFFLAWRFWHKFRRWNSARLELTSELVESMVGHRTRLAQQDRDHWHEQEDADLENYLAASRQVDRSGCWLIAAIPRAWLLLGLAGMAPSLIAGSVINSDTAILLGGVLLAYSAFQRLAGSFTDVAAAAVAWRNIKPLFDAAGRRELPGQFVSSSPGQVVIDAERLAFRYPGQADLALKDCALSIRRGDRVLLEGPSGGGKTTLSSLLAGLRKPQSGLLLANGLDRHTLGEQGWRKRVAAVPQFHENHIVTGTLAFNLLLARQKNLTPADMQEAEDLCRELALGPLLDRMPGGLLQMVGEGGWQLSHGERSRIFLARALLQNSDMVILDETFAALDPESLRQSMECALRRAGTLLVIAHP